MAKVANERGYTARRRRADYSAVFGSDSGRRVLNDLAAFHFLFAPTIADGEANERLMMIREGERRVVLRIMQVLNMRIEDVPEVASAMMEQFKEE